MTRLDAFTNAPGYWAGEYHSRVTRTNIRYAWGADAPERTGATGTAGYSESYKAPTTSGGKPGSWRRPTAYSRCLSRCVSSSSWKYSFEDSVGRTVVSADSAFAWLGIQFQGNPFFGVDGSLQVSSAIVARAQTEALTRIIDQKINVGVALAESAKTVDWLAEKVLQLFNAYRHLRKGQFRDLYSLLVGTRRRGPKRKSLPRKARDFAGTPSSWWLQYWYAFMPLVWDVHGVAEQVEAGLREDNLLFSVMRTITQPTTPPWSPLSTSHISSYFNCWESGHATESCRVKLWGRISCSQLASLNQLGFLNPALIAWELVPFSFVIDWVVPIGRYLESLTATSGVTFHDGFQTCVVKGKYDAYVGTHIPGSGSGLDGWTFVSPARGSWEFYAMSRQPLDAWPVPVTFVKGPWSTKNVLTAIALTVRKS